MDNYLFIINPIAGNGKVKKLIPVIKDYLSKTPLNNEIVYTERPLHATEIVNENLNNYKNFISVGGDGTLNEIINGLEYNSKINLGVLPIGSGNDFAQYLKMKSSMQDNLNLFFNNHAKFLDVDLGIVEIKEKGSSRIKKHRFVNSLGIGFDAYVAHLNQQNKAFRGIISYILAVFKGLSNYKPIYSKIILDNDLNLSGKNLLITIGNGKTSGGGFYLTPNAKIDDGKFEVCVVDFMKRFRVMQALPMAVFNKIEKVKEAVLYEANTIEIVLKEPYFVHTDGEIVSTKAENLKITLVKSNIKAYSY